MKMRRHPWLVLFLMLCLPAQALAAVLVECEQHSAESHTAEVTYSVSDTHHTSHHGQTVSVAPDCHGTSASRESADTADTLRDSSRADNLASNADANSCFHCNGTCQSFKPLTLIPKSQIAQIVDNNAFSRLDQATETGIRSNPARPPCPLFLS